VQWSIFDSIAVYLKHDATSDFIRKLLTKNKKYRQSCWQVERHPRGLLTSAWEGITKTSTQRKPNLLVCLTSTQVPSIIKALKEIQVTHPTYIVGNAKCCEFQILCYAKIANIY